MDHAKSVKTAELGKTELVKVLGLLEVHLSSNKLPFASSR